MKKYLLVLPFLALVACSDDDKGGAAAIPGSDLPALTDEQKSRMAVVSQDINDVTAATLDKKKVVQGNADNKATLSEKAQTYTNTVDKFITSGECSLVETGVSPENAQNSEGNIDYKVEINSTDTKICPFTSVSSIKVQSNFVQSETSMVGSIKFSLDQKFDTIHDSELYKQVDVYAFDQTFNADMKVNGNAAGGTVTMAGSGTGNIYSKTEKLITSKLTFTVNGAGNDASNSVNMQIVIEFNFQDFKAVGVANMVAVNGGEAVPTFFINGKSATQEEFAKFFSPSMTEGVVSNSPLGQN